MNQHLTTQPTYRGKLGEFLQRSVSYIMIIVTFFKAGTRTRLTGESITTYFERTGDHVKSLRGWKTEMIERVRDKRGQ